MIKTDHVERKLVAHGVCHGLFWVKLSPEVVAYGRQKIFFRDVRIATALWPSVYDAPEGELCSRCSLLEGWQGEPKGPGSGYEELRRKCPVALRRRPVQEVSVEPSVTRPRRIPYPRVARLVWRLPGREAVVFSQCFDEFVS